MRFILFASIFSAVFALITFYISYRWVRRLHFSQKTRKALHIFLLINFLGVIGYMFARYEADVPSWLYFLLSLPIGVIFLLFVAALCYEVLMLFGSGRVDARRREFFKKGFDFASLFAAGGLISRSIYEARYIEKEQVDVAIRGLQKEFRIVQLSDVHIGGLIDKNFIKEMVESVNAMQPDAVVITGDLIDTSVKYIKAPLQELRVLKSSYGTYFVPGNHEYFHNIEEILEEMKNLHITPLENSSIYIGEPGSGFNLIGVYDVFGERYGSYKPDINKALNGIDTDAPSILLAHQPRYLSKSSDLVDLQLSGHTHGGQIFPFETVVRLVQPYTRGLHRHSERTQIYVSKGTGFWGPPMRLFASSEITILNLSAA